MVVYKVVARSIETGNQVKKKLYAGNDKYEKHSQQLIDRWSEYYDISVYICDYGVDFDLLYEIKGPRTEEDLKKMKEERNFSDNWLKYRIKDLK